MCGLLEARAAHLLVVRVRAAGNSPAAAAQFPGFSCSRYLPDVEPEELTWYFQGSCVLESVNTLIHLGCGADSRKLIAAV